MSKLLKAFRKGGKEATRKQGGFATNRTTFFDLPTEIRNEIYALTAKSTVLRVLDNTKKSKASARDLVQVPGLLLASRRTRQEYLPILLSNAHVEVFIVNFDFRKVTRLCSSLYRTEMKALRSNDNLTLLLLLPQPGKCKEEFANLHRWTTDRAKGLDRLPWTYCLAPESASPASFECRVQCLDRLFVIDSILDESLQWELLRILDLVRGTCLAKNEYCAY